ncbi:MAG TPA: hypothetical protein VGH48_08130, partial [Caldimonas sp.]
SWNPLWANLQVYAELARDAWRARHWLDRLRVWWKAPGWRPADVAARWPKPAFAIDAVARYDPAVPRTRQVLAFAVFVALLTTTMLFLWYSHAMSWPQRVAAAAAILAALWAIGRLSEGSREGARLAGSAASLPSETPRPSTP